MPIEFAISSRALTRRSLRPTARATMTPISAPASPPASPYMIICFTGVGPVAILADSSSCACTRPTALCGELT